MLVLPATCILHQVSRFYSYINTAKNILQKYIGEEPCLSGRQAFATFLKKYFAVNKKHGSKDRKQISHLCYCYFRLGKAVSNKEEALEEDILTGLFLCSSEPNEILQEIRPEWNAKIMLPVNEKCSMFNLPRLTVGQEFSPPDRRAGMLNVFPWNKELSEGIDHEKFCESFFVQPDLFIRIRPGYAEQVLLKLNELKIGYEFISPFCVRLPNSFNADQHFALDKEIVVQDYSSQQIERFLPLTPGLTPLTVWDCCAGSGGKSILAYDLKPDIQLTVSDRRESILTNLNKRFAKAGILKYTAVVLDLEKENILHRSPFGQQAIINNPPMRDAVGQEFSIIIADVPCTGSGTWSRTPEQLHFFNPRAIEQYSYLQKKIVSNIIPHLKSGGHLVYSTCSVFKKENEEVVNFIKEKFHLQLKQMELIKGYGKKADTMFIALFNS